MTSPGELLFHLDEEVVGQIEIRPHVRETALDYSPN